MPLLQHGSLGGLVDDFDLGHGQVGQGDHIVDGDLVLRTKGRP